MKQIILIGPFFPYRGGIAQHTKMLYEALSKKYKVIPFSYKLQYPKKLYPGKEQKDYTNIALRIEGIQQVLNTINPFNWVTSAIKIIKMKPEAVIIQWWHPFMAPMYIVITCLLRLFSKTKVVLMCHNTLPHERFPLDKLLFKMLGQLVSGVIFHSTKEMKKAEELAGIKKSLHFVHPLYDQFNNYNHESGESKKSLGIKDKAILFFGFVREYKGLHDLIEAMPKIIKKYPELKLVIAGDFFEDKDNYIKKMEELGIRDNIIIQSEYIPDEEVGRYFMATELVVLPYISATQSGIVAMAYGFNRPVIVTDLEGLTEVVQQGETGFIIPVKDSESIAESVVQFYEKNRSTEMELKIKEFKQNISWDEFSNKIVEFISG